MSYLQKIASNLKKHLHFVKFYYKNFLLCIIILRTLNDNSKHKKTHNPQLKRQCSDVSIRYVQIKGRIA